MDMDQLASTVVSLILLLAYGRSKLPHFFLNTFLHKKSFTRKKFIAVFQLVQIAKAMSPEPEFAETIRNVTVPLGREAVLSCIINNLADHKVKSTC